MIALMAGSGINGGALVGLSRFSMRTSQNAEPLLMRGETSHRSEPLTKAACSGSTFSWWQSAIALTSFCVASSRGGQKAGCEVLPAGGVAQHPMAHT